MLSQSLAQVPAKYVSVQCGGYSCTCMYLEIYLSVVKVFYYQYQTFTNLTLMNAKIFILEKSAIRSDSVTYDGIPIPVP